MSSRLVERGVGTLKRLHGSPVAASGVTSAPQGLALTANGPGSIVASWTPPASVNNGPVSGYELTVSPTVGTVKLDPAARSYAVTGLIEFQTYTFSIKARNGSGLSTAATTTGEPPTPVPFDPLTYDFDANSGLADPVAAAARTIYGTVTVTASGWFIESEVPGGSGSGLPTSYHSFDSGTGTALDPYVIDGMLIRDIAARNVLGSAVDKTYDGLGTRNNRQAGLILDTINGPLRHVRIANVAAPYCVSVDRVSQQRHADVTLQHCHFAVPDYRTSTPPTTSRYTGSAIGSAAFREFYFDPLTRDSYYIDPAGSWTWAGTFWKYPNEQAPASPVVGRATQYWAQCNPSYVAGVSTFAQADQWKVLAFWKWNGTGWDDITSTVCPNVVSPNNGRSHTTLGVQCDGLVVDHCFIFSAEDAVQIGVSSTLSSGLPGPYRFRYSIISGECGANARWRPHADGIQAMAGAGWYIQRCKLIAGNSLLDGGFDGNTVRDGVVYSCELFFQAAQGTLSDVLISENLFYDGQKTVQFNPRDATHDVTGARVRNNVFGRLASPAYNLEGAASWAPTGSYYGTEGTYKWTGNRRADGSLITTTMRLAGAAFDGSTSTRAVDDADPTNEGVALK